MNQTEFWDWYDGHKSRFPGLEAWFSQMIPPTRNRVWSEWFRVLGPLPGKSCEAASRKLWKDGGCGFGNHPVEIRRLVAEASPAASDNSIMGPSILEITPAQRTEARSVIADARAALVGAGKDADHAS